MKNSAVGKSWDDVEQDLYTKEEIVASDFRVALMCSIIEARKGKGITQKQLEELSGVRQPVIARMEKGTANTQIDTLLKILEPLGYKLAIVPIE